MTRSKAKPEKGIPASEPISPDRGESAENALPDDGDENQAALSFESVPRKRSGKRLIGWLLPALILLAGILSAFFFLKSAEQRLISQIGLPDPTLNPLVRVRTMAFLYGRLDDLKSAPDGSGDALVFTITAGESVPQLTARLAEMGLATDEALLRTYLVYSGIDKKLIPGSYMLSQGMSPLEISRRLGDFNESLIHFTLLPGQRLEEIAALIDVSGFAFSGAEFLQAARDFPPEAHPTGGRSLEGYFLSGSYEIGRTISLSDFLHGFVSAFRQRITPEMEANFAANGLTTAQAVILGSIIAREAMSAEEHARIASVFYNRLRAGMKLESDPTAQYALGWDAGSNSWWKMPLYGSDLGVYSEYNTYVIAGLPAGPICSPSLAVLQAVAAPASTPFYYFRGRCDGSPLHNFAVTYEEHVQNGCQ